ncbi:MAG: response regulator [Nitrospirae bacterium]|nr:response regulator [Nitrospirota bacterium]
MNPDPFPKKILVVEDDPTVREYFRMLFSSKGYPVETASRVEEAIRHLAVDRFPVVVTDLKLPGRSGLEILDHLEESGLRTAVLVVTAYGSMELVIEALRRGAYDFIPKPFTSGILLHRIARAMEKVRMEEEKQRQDAEMASLLRMTRELSSRIIYSTEEERRQISRELHDGIGQSLSIIKLTLKAIRNKHSEKNAEISREIADVADVVEETMEEISRITKGLHPSYVTEMGFFQTLRLYLETFSRKTGIQVQSRLPETLSFQTPDQEVHLYRIVQEALTNISKHAMATRVEIRLEPSEKILHFSISDNGKGFEGPHGERVGLGLIGMRERAAILGGKLRIASAPGQGTTIEAEIPYEPPLSLIRS